MKTTLAFDTETTGFKTNYIIQLAYLMFNDDTGKIISETNYKFNLPDGIDIDEGASKVHGVYKKDLAGEPLISDSISDIIELLNRCDKIVCHNASFDLRMIKGEAARANLLVDWDVINAKAVCTMNSTKKYVRALNKYGKLKVPKLAELHQFLFNEDFENAHDAMGDVMATYKCYMELKERKILL